VGVSTPKGRARAPTLSFAAAEAGHPCIETPSLRREGSFAEFAAWRPELLVCL
jgi:hypothetical protein